MGVFGPDATAVQRDRPLRDAEAEADPARIGLTRRVHAKERLEDLADRFFGNSGAEIADRDSRRVTGCFQPDLDARGLRRVADRIHYDVLYGTSKHFVVSVD